VIVGSAIVVCKLEMRIVAVSKLECSTLALEEVAHRSYLAREEVLEEEVAKKAVAGHCLAVVGVAVVDFERVVVALAAGVVDVAAGLVVELVAEPAVVAAAEARDLGDFVVDHQMKPLWEMVGG
jgi:uncharacterized protein YfeS